VREKLFVDADVPDLCFTLVDGRNVAIEVKVLSGERDFSALRQYRAWFNAGAGAHKPTGWVVASEAWIGSSTSLMRKCPAEIRTAEEERSPICGTPTAFECVELSISSHVALCVLRKTLWTGA